MQTQQTKLPNKNADKEAITGPSTISTNSTEQQKVNPIGRR